MQFWSMTPSLFVYFEICLCPLVLEIYNIKFSHSIGQFSNYLGFKATLSWWCRFVVLIYTDLDANLTSVKHYYVIPRHVSVND